MLSDKMRALIEENTIALAATVTPDGRPAVSQAQLLRSPAYDAGATEPEIIAHWLDFYSARHR